VKTVRHSTAEFVALDSKPLAWRWRSWAKLFVILMAVSFALISMIGIAVLWMIFTRASQAHIEISLQTILLLTLAVPILEETIFRLGIHRQLLYWPRLQAGFTLADRMVVSLANLVTAGLFVVAHLPSQGLHGLATLVPAIMIGLVYDRYHSVWPCVMLHAAFNFAWLLAGQLT
jgi:membrane protease YdiL (CAAX protease family)